MIYNIKNNILIFNYKFRNCKVNFCTDTEKRKIGYYTSNYARIVYIIYIIVLHLYNDMQYIVYSIVM